MPSYFAMRSSSRESMRVRAVWYSLRSSFRRGLARSESRPSGSNARPSSSARSSSVGSVAHASKSAAERVRRTERNRRRSRAAPSALPISRISTGESTPDAPTRPSASETSESSTTGSGSAASRSSAASRASSSSRRVAERVDAKGSRSASVRPMCETQRDASAASRRSHSRSFLVLSGQGSRS
jgi:hypothetical protein